MTPMIRPEVRAALWRFREGIAAAVLGGIGAWLCWLGGFILIPIGIVTVALALALGVLSLRRLRFAQPGDAPGVVELDEGQISYFGLTFGGAISVPELVELRLMTAAGRRMWRLKQSDGQALLIPVEAAGADQLFDAFAALPGMQTSALVAALDPVAKGAPPTGLAVQGLPDSRVIWQRAAKVVLT